MTFFYNLNLLNNSSSKGNFGGKGNALIHLKNLGIPVPKAILFDLDEIQKMLERRIKEYSSSLEIISFWRTPNESIEPIQLKTIREKILSLDMPNEWNEIFFNVQIELGNSLIVRSSMNIEDQENGSFAGCFDSVEIMNPNAQMLWKCVVQVIASAFKTTSTIRILESGISLKQFQTGFFIQQWISPKIAGVCFSRNPANLWEKKGQIEWDETGELVVQGKGKTQTVKQFETYPFELKFFIDKLWTYSKELEIKIGLPLDIEWVWDSKELWIVQMRPISTEEAVIIKNTRKGARWSRELTLERFPEPLTSLGWTALEDIFTSNIQILNKDFGIIIKNMKEAGIAYGGYVYANPDLFQFPSAIKIRWSHYFAPWKKTFWKLFGVSFKYIYHKLIDKNSNLSFYFLKLKFINIMLGSKAEKEIHGWNNHRDIYLNKLEIFNKNLNLLDLSNPLNILKSMEELRLISIGFMEPDISIYLMKDILYRSLKDIWLILGYSELEFTDLVNCFEGNRTMKMGEEWETLVSYLKMDPGCSRFLDELSVLGKNASIFLNPDVQDIWNSFLIRNGHVRTSWDLAKPSWREDPSQLAYILKQFLQGNQRNIHKTEEKRNSARSKLFNSIPNNKIKVIIPLLEKALFQLEGLMKIDEEQHFLSGVLIEPSRKLILMAEKYFQEKGILHEAGSIFFLKLDEIKKCLLEPKMNLKFLALRRRYQWERSKLDPKPMELPPKNVENSLGHNESIERSNLFRGKPVSPGIASGPIHFVEHIEDTYGIPNGAILVTTSPNPSFTPIYPILSGMITVTGGSLSHGFISAREYGLPAISGINNALQKFNSGMIVRIDGSNGTVEIIN